MAAQRKARPYVYRPKPLGDGDEFLDRVSLGGVKTVQIGSEDRINPTFSVIQTGRSIKRQPRDLYNPPNVIDIFDLNPGIKMIPPGKKWCSTCGEWVKVEGYSPDKRNRDGLHSSCKMCRAEHARKIYWAAKHTGVPQAA